MNKTWTNVSTSVFIFIYNVSKHRNQREDVGYTTFCQWWNIRVQSELFHYLVVSGWIISIIWLDAGYRIVCFSKKMHRKTFVDCPRHYFFVYICCGPTQFSRTKWRPKLKVLSFGRFSLSNIFYDLSQSKLLGGPPPLLWPWWCLY